MYPKRILNGAGKQDGSIAPPDHTSLRSWKTDKTLEKYY